MNTIEKIDKTFKRLSESPTALFLTGIPLLIAGFAVDGLLPWQLPAVILGGWLCMRGITYLN